MEYPLIVHGGSSSSSSSAYSKVDQGASCGSFRCVATPRQPPRCASESAAGSTRSASSTLPWAAAVLVASQVPGAIFGSKSPKGRASKRVHVCRAATVPQLIVPLKDEADTQSASAEVPSPHITRDSWYDKACPSNDGSSGRAVSEMKRESSSHIEQLNLMEAHQLSYADFIENRLPQVLAELQGVVKLDGASVVPISKAEDEDQMRVVSDNNEFDRSSPLTSIKNAKRELNKEIRKTEEKKDPEKIKRLEALLTEVKKPDGIKSARLSSILGAEDRNRFKIRLLSDLVYIKSDGSEAEPAQRQKVSNSMDVIIPATVTDGVTGFSFDVEVRLGAIPLLSDHCTFSLNGQKQVMVHRLQKMPGCYYGFDKEKLVMDLQLKTMAYTTVSVRLVPTKWKKDTEQPACDIVLKLPGGGRGRKVNPFIFLCAVGFTQTEFEELANTEVGKEEWPNMTQEEACRALLKEGWNLTDFTTTTGGPIDALVYRLAYLTTDSPLGPLGRRRFNEYLGINLPEDCARLTFVDVMAAIAYMYKVGKPLFEVRDFTGAEEKKELINETARSLQEDDWDSMENKRVRMIGEVLETILRDWIRDKMQQVAVPGATQEIFPVVVDFRYPSQAEPRSGGLLEFMRSMLQRDNNFQLCDDCNPLSELMQVQRITQVSDQGLAAVTRIESIRLIHPTQHGRACPIETGEGKAAGIVMTKATCARLTAEGELVAPYQRVVNGHRQWQEPWQYIYASEQLASRVVQYDTAHDRQGKLSLPERPTSDPEAAGAFKSLPVVHLGRFSQSRPETVERVACAPPTSPAVGLIPFVEHDDANRSLMGAKMQEQAVPCLRTERAIVGTGMEVHIASNSSWSVRSHFSGQVLSADGSGAMVVTTTSDGGHLDASDGNAQAQALEADSLPDGFVRVPLKVTVEASPRPYVDIDNNKKRTLKHHTPVVGTGDLVAQGEAIAEGTCISGGELALGKNLVCAYMPYEGYNYEDAIVLSKRVVTQHILTSVHVETVTHAVQNKLFTDTLYNDDKTTLAYPHLDTGLVREGTYVYSGDALALEVDDRPGAKGPIKIPVPETIPEGRVIDVQYRLNEEVWDDDESRFIKAKEAVITVKIALTCPVQVGDKLAGRHGNKGIVALLQEEHAMPFMPDGTPVDIVLNPLGVPSRMNVGQILECLLGIAGTWSGQEYKVAPFDEMFSTEASRGVIFSALKEAKEVSGYDFLLDPRHPGKMRLFDGRDGQPFDQPVTVGVAYILKLYHMVRDKIHNRSTALNPQKGYDRSTGQPVKGRRRGGGQRLGEMEVSALVAHRVPGVLQELMTIKSDDVQGREEADLAMSRGEPVKLPFGASPEGTRTYQQDLAAAGFVLTTGSRKGGRRGDSWGIQRRTPDPSKLSNSDDRPNSRRPSHERR